MSAEDKRKLYSDVQRRLVGSLVNDGSDTAKVLELISSDDIEEPSLNLVFEAIAELTRTNDELILFTVASNLEAKGMLKAAGGIDGLHSLKAEGLKYSFDASPVVYARIVKESSAKAKISRTITEHKDYFTDDSGKRATEAISELQASINEQMLGLSDSSTVSKIRSSAEGYLDLLDERARISDENAEMSNGLQGIPTLLPTLNYYTSGWTPGQLVTVGASTGVGKSVFAINCATAAFHANKTVLFFSLEMAQNEVEDRIFSSTSGIPLRTLKQGKLTNDQRKLLEDHLESMKENNFVLDVEPKHTVDTIRARALRQAQSPEGLDFVIVDYLQLIQPTGRHGSRQEAVADISRNMKLLAKQLNVPIMVLVQLKRKNDTSDDSLPTVDDIRESASIGQDSDIVILLHRERPADESIPNTLVIIDKNRSGESYKKIQCHSGLDCSIFREVVRVKDTERMSEEELEQLSTEIDLDDFQEDDDFSNDDFDLGL